LACFCDDTFDIPDADVNIDPNPIEDSERLGVAELVSWGVASVGTAVTVLAGSLDRIASRLFKYDGTDSKSPILG
jgi:hypothetical protein